MATDAEETASPARRWACRRRQRRQATNFAGRAPAHWRHGRKDSGRRARGRTPAARAAARRCVSGPRRCARGPPHSAARPAGEWATALRRAGAPRQRRAAARVGRAGACNRPAARSFRAGRKQLPARAASRSFPRRSARPASRSCAEARRTRRPGRRRPRPVLAVRFLPCRRPAPPYSPCLPFHANTATKPLAACHFVLQLAGDALAPAKLLPDPKLPAAIPHDGFRLRVAFKALGKAAHLAFDLGAGIVVLPAAKLPALAL